MVDVLIEALKAMIILTFYIAVVPGLIYFGLAFLLWFISEGDSKYASLARRLLDILDPVNFPTVLAILFILAAIFLTEPTSDNVYEEYRSIDNRGYLEP